MSDIQMITPKKTKADIMNILNSYSFSDEEINRLKYIYTKEWGAYKKGVSTFLENQGEEILNIEGMSLMLSKITSNKPDSDYEYKEKLFSEEKRSIFCQWLFKSHIMALENCDRKIGNHIDHHLPIILHLYLNEGRAKRLQDPNLDMQFKIDDYNKLSNLIIDKINEYLGEFYEIDIMEPITTEGPFDHIVANLKMVTIYQQSEDTYINTFLNSLMNKINETSSIESFTRSEELFGLFGKKKKESSNNNDKIDCTKLPGFKKEIFEKCISLFKRAWNYKAYKLPTDMGKIEPGYEDQFENEEEINERRDDCEFTKYIGEHEGHWIDRDPIVKSDKLVIAGEGIFDFAIGQPTEFVNYNKTLKDISSRWGKRLSEKESVVKEYLSKYYNNVSISTNVDTGDGDEGCVYPEYTITIPISELQKPIKKSKEELLKLCETGTKILMKAFQKNGSPKGFTLRSKDEINDEIHDYLTDKDSSSITIGDIDAWEFTNGKARDQAEYEKYNNVLINIENDIKRLIKQMNYPCNITSDGSDWDDGCYWININEQPDFKEIKNYMS